MYSQPLSHHFAASVFNIRMLLVIRLGGREELAQTCRSSCHPDHHCVTLADRWRAKKMSEVSLTKRKEKCENCTKQVNNLPLDLRWRLQGRALKIPVLFIRSVQQETEREWCQLTPGGGGSGWTGKECLVTEFLGSNRFGWVLLLVCSFKGVVLESKTGLNLNLSHVVLFIYFIWFAPAAEPTLQSYGVLKWPQLIKINKRIQ